MPAIFAAHMLAENLTPHQAYPKIRQYCAYQNRCHSEVRSKLYDYGLHKNDVEEIMSKLVEENHLNEERFAINFAGGRFRIKHWGRVKIKYELKQKQVSDYCIKKALDAIDKPAYLKTFKKLADTKEKLLKSEKNIFTKKKKLHDYLRMKGYEPELIHSIPVTIIKKASRT